MKTSTIIEIAVLIILIGVAYTFLQPPSEETFSSQPTDLSGKGTNMLETSVPLIEKNARWGKTNLMVYIDERNSEYTSDYLRKYIDNFFDGANILSDSIGNKIMFTRTTNPDLADIEVKWVEHLRSDSLDAIGHAELNFTVTRSFSVINKANIELLTTKDNVKLNGDQMVALSMHELGHAIGLGHSQNKQSIMYPEAQSDVIEPDDIDVQSILEAYRLDPLPDLYVSEADFSKRIVTRSIIKQYLYDGTVVITNDGLSESGTFMFVIEAGKDSLEQEGKSLRPGESIVLTLENVNAEEDFSSIRIYVDRNNLIEELDENNLHTALV